MLEYSGDDRVPRCIFEVKILQKISEGIAQVSIYSRDKGVRAWRYNV